MKKIFSYILALAGAAALAFTSCQEPDELIPSDARNGINSFSAWFPDDDDNVFEGTIDYDAQTITVVIPYTWPAETDQHLEYSDLTKMRVGATLDDNVIVRPVLLFMDLSHENTIKVTGQDKTVKDYRIITEIRKSAECAVTEYTLPELGLKSVVNEGKKTISIISDGALTPAVAEAKLSFGACISSTPDPTKEKVDYSKGDFKFTVTAQDGTTTCEYTVVTTAPSKKESGMRSGSAKILWTQNMKDFGIGTMLNTTGMAVTKDYIVFNTLQEDLVYISRKTGEKAGTIALTAKDSDQNFYVTSDWADNILVCNHTNCWPTYLSPFTIYRIKGVDGKPEKYLEYTCSDELGRRISVIGDLDGDAIITAPVYVGKAAFYRWTVKGGKLDTTPAIVYPTISLYRAWNYCCDFCYTDPTDTKSDYVMASYAGWNWFSNPAYNVCNVWFDGTTNAPKAYSEGKDGSYVPVSCDACIFNGSPVAVFNSVNPQTWGVDDMVYFFDLSTGNMDATEWQTDGGTYGSFATNNVYNTNYRGDVALRTSDDGCFLYLYFYFAAGQVGAVRFDCLDM